LVIHLYLASQPRLVLQRADPQGDGLPGETGKHTVHLSLRASPINFADRKEGDN
jgi:hypothetical protein